jgi:hypothetical protein
VGDPALGNFKSLVHIAAADIGEAVKTRYEFKAAADAARAVFEVLRAAESRLLAAIAALGRDGAPAA